MKTNDLHIHTTASDGTYTPKELVDYAVKKNLSAIAITGGTDFLGSRKPGIDLGSGFGDMTIPYDIVSSLKSLHID